MADPLADLADRVELLEKLFQTHLGPARAATSMNIPHQDVATGTDLTALTVRVVTLETSVATLQTNMTAAQANITTLQSNMTTAQTNITTLNTQVTALTASTNTAGRYM